MIRIAQILGRMNGCGAEQMVMNYYGEIDGSEARFDFFVFEDSKFIPFKEISALDGRIYKLPVLDKEPKAYYKELKRLLEENGYEAAHCHLSTLSGIPLMAAKNAGIKHRIVHNHSTAGGEREKLRNFAKKILKPTAKMFATQYFACSKLAAEWMYGNKIPIVSLSSDIKNEKSVRIMPNAVNIEKFAFDEDKRLEARKEFRIALNTKVFGHIGRFCPQKNQEFLIDIFAEILKKRENSVLILAGTGDDQPAIKQKVQNMKMSNKVIFTGQYLNPEKLYSCFDCLIMPSKYEGLPVVGVEAQCAGLPCFFSDNITKEAALLPSAEFLSLDNPPELWADKALSSAYDRTPNASSIVKERGFDIKDNAGRLLEFYMRLLNS